MQKMIMLFLYAATCFSQEIQFQKKEVAGIPYYFVSNKDNVHIGSVSVSNGSLLVPYTTLSEEKLAMLPQEIVAALKPLIKTLHAIGLEKAATTGVIGDLYIHPQYRNNGYARTLLQHVCEQESQRYDLLILIPHPFEVENNALVMLEQEEFTARQKQLINLYEKCGFALKTIDGAICYMYKTLIK